MRDCKFAPTPSAISSRGGKARRPTLRRSGRGRTPTRFPSRAASTARSACWARWKLSDRCRQRWIRAASVQPGDSALFTSEEPTRFGLGCLGSRVLSGALAPDRADEFDRCGRADGGRRSDDTRHNAGFTGDLMADVRSAGRTTTTAFVELHIEQGPILEARRAGHWHRDRDRRPRRPACDPDRTGRARGRGPDARPPRCPPVRGGRESLLAVEQAAKRRPGSPDTVGDDRRPAKSFPARSTASPARVEMEIDHARHRPPPGAIGVVASPSAPRSTATCRRARHRSDQIDVLNADPPATCAGRVVEAIEAAALGSLFSGSLTPRPPSQPVAGSLSGKGEEMIRQEGQGIHQERQAVQLPSDNSPFPEREPATGWEGGRGVRDPEKRELRVRNLVSRAYHDTLFMARLAPVGMIFIPCRGGVSHRPDEYSTPEQIERGVAVLALTLARLSLETGQ